MYAVTGYRGMGDVAPGPITSTIGGSLLTAAPFTGPAAPFVAIAGAVTEIAGSFLSIFGVGVPDMKKIQASKYADELSPYFAQLLSSWKSLPPAQLTDANKAQYVAIFNTLWDKLVQLCSDPNLGSAGENCIKDRQRGGKFDTFRDVLDPIVNTPTTPTPTDTAAVYSNAQGAVASVAGSITGNWSPILILGLVLLGAGVFLRD